MENYMTTLIYLIENTINHKCYVGRTKQPVNERWSHHKSKALSGANKCKFANAIRKHGPDCWTVTVIDRTEDEHANDLERFYVTKYDSMNKGYNSTIGGDGYIYPSYTWKCEECGCEKELLSNKYNKKKRYCNKSCAASATNKLRWKDQTYNEKVSLSIGKSMKKGVFYNDTFYESLHDAVASTGIPLSTIYWRAKHNKEGWRLPS
jgi:hypothetical protein